MCRPDDFPPHSAPRLTPVTDVRPGDDLPDHGTVSALIRRPDAVDLAVKAPGATRARWVTFPALRLVRVL